MFCFISVILSPLFNQFSLIYLFSIDDDTRNLSVSQNDLAQAMLESSTAAANRVVSLSMTINPSGDLKSVISNGHATYRIKDKPNRNTNTSSLNNINAHNNNIEHLNTNGNTNGSSGSSNQANGEYNKLSKEERVRLVREKREQELLKRKKEIEDNLKRKQELREKQIQERKKRINEHKHKENEKRTAAVERRKKREEMARVSF
jgi:hypothetical protein